MTYAELKELAQQYGLKVDPGHAGAGKFRDVEVGAGSPLRGQLAFMIELKRKGVTCHLQKVTNPDHAEYGKIYIELPSFWCE